MNKSLSFIIAGANTVRLLSGKDKVTINSTIGLANDISILTNSITNTIKKNFNLVKERRAKGLIQKIFSKENVKATNNASGKIIALLGIPLIVASAYSDVDKYYEHGDYDAAFLVTLKSALTLTLLLAVPLTVGTFLLLAVIELAWYLLSHRVIDSKLERYIKKSLFFKDIPFLEISYKNKSIWGKSFKSEILLNTISKDKELKALNNEGFSNIKDIKNFIGDNYTKHKEMFDASLKNELNQINIALLGYKIEHLNKNIKKPLYTLNNGYVAKGNFNTIVKMDKELISNAIILVCKNGQYEQVSTTPYEEDYIYDFTKAKYEDYNWQNKGTSEVERLVSSSCYIILSNDHAKIKYKVIFKKEYTSIGFTPIIDIKIDDLKDELLNDEDYKRIEEIKNENKK